MGQPSIYSEEERRARRKVYVKAWRAANKKKLSAYSRAWEAKNKEHVAAKNKTYLALNRERVRANERARRARTKEKVKAYRAAHYALNKERLRAKVNAYRARNRDRINAKEKASRAANPQYKAQAVARTIAWVKANPERHLEHSNRRRALKIAAEGSHSLAEWAALQEKCGHRCACCGAAKRLTRDHIVPLSRGGSDWIENIQPLCKSCNCAKRDRHAINYMASAPC